MSNPGDLPLALYKANTEFQLRVNKLVMENWRKWLEMSTRAVDDGIAESQARVEQLLKAQDWVGLATIPADTFWRQLQQRMGDANVTNQIAANVQQHFAQGLQDAFETWQKDTARALSGLGEGALSTTQWSDMMGQWGHLWPWANSKGPTQGK
ncbi:phasin family protein [Dyella solisilvae]|uniref:Phasin family protein n=1 Tax=Dyella solisilvae TaxID=1920168 RepID=A0A370K5B4_9GAMM|nr:phasin family protein [Dyella solisilvae]RDI97823.1 phasin family protein [Dyella solisilvae]